MALEITKGDDLIGLVKVLSLGGKMCAYKGHGRRYGGHGRYESAASVVPGVPANVAMDPLYRLLESQLGMDTAMETYEAVSNYGDKPVPEEGKRKLAERINDGGDRYLVVLGMGSIVDTAIYLDGKIPEDKTIVFTGSRIEAERIVPRDSAVINHDRVVRVPDSDAPMQLGYALGVAQLAKPGIYVALDGRTLSLADVASGRIDRQGYTITKMVG